MANFVKVQGNLPQETHRLNIDHIVSYVAVGTGPVRTNITLATGGAVTVEISPDDLDRLIAEAGGRVFTFG